MTTIPPNSEQLLSLQQRLAKLNADELDAVESLVSMIEVGPTLTSELRRLVERIDREWLATDQTSTPGGKPLDGEALGRDIGWRQGWNASQKSVRVVLERLCDSAEVQRRRRGRK